MTASVGREVDANLLRGAAPGSAHSRTEAQDAGRQDLGDLVEPLGGRHEVGVEGFTPAQRPQGPRGLTLLHTDYLPGPESRCRALPPEAKVFRVGRRSGFVYVWRAAASACRGPMSSKLTGEIEPMWTANSRSRRSWRRSICESSPSRTD